VRSLLLGDTNHATLPAQGWPWPWEDSRTTDYAYAYTPKGIMVSLYGHGWVHLDECPSGEWDDTKTAVFPDMSDRKAVATGGRSGLLYQDTCRKRRRESFDNPLILPV